MNNPHILVVDDDPTMITLCRAVLQRQGWTMTSAANRKEAENSLKEGRFDLVVLDLNLPDGDGLDLGRALHRLALPFLLMTARSEPDERLAGFETGAADYLVKPFHPNELSHRVQRILERLPAPTYNGVLPRIGPWLFHSDRQLLIGKEGHQITLTQGEYGLLTVLLEAEGRVVPREQLARAVARNEEAGHYRTVDVLVSRLRKKMESDPTHPALIVTVVGAGYRLVTDPEFS